MLQFINNYQKFCENLYFLAKLLHSTDGIMWLLISKNHLYETNHLVAPPAKRRNTELVT